MSKLKRPESNPNQSAANSRPTHSNNPGPWVLDVDPVTLLVIIAALLLIPLLLTGFIAQ